MVQRKAFINGKVKVGDRDSFIMVTSKKNELCKDRGKKNWVEIMCRRK